MPRSYPTAVARGLVAAALFVAIGGSALADGAFTPGFHCTGVDGTVFCALVHDGDLYVGGNIVAAGDVAARFVASWDGQQWHALGCGFDGYVYGLAVFEGDLVACGEFIHAGDLAVNQVARWDGDQWHALGTGISDDPYDGGRHALAVHDGNLWCDGWIYHDGWWSEWLPTNGWVTDLEVVDDLLVMAGDFSQVSGASHDNVVGLQGWSRVAMPGMDQAVVDLEVHDGQVHALRYWQEYVDPPPVAVWNGTGWDDVGDITEVGDVSYKRLLSRDGQLYLLGLDDPYGLWSARIATWNGVSWNWNLGALAYPGVVPELIADHPEGMILAGRLGAAGGTPACGLVLLGEDDVQALGPPGLGASGRDTTPVWGMTATPEGVVVCGTFEGVGTLHSGTVALFDGTQWLSRDMGEEICHLTAWYDGQLHAFPRTGEDSYPQQAIWNGAGWEFHDVGTELWVQTSFIVHDGRLLTAGTHVCDWSETGAPVVLAETDVIGQAIVPWGDGYALGGLFSTVDGVPADRVAIWDGENWSCPGGGMNVDVYALVEFEGRLIAGGRFTEAGGGPAQCVAAWDGQTWEPLGDGLSSWVNALAVYRGELYAGGRFTSSGGEPLRRLARWSDGAWHDVGGGCDTEVDDLVVFEDRLYLAGNFHLVGDDLPACRIAVWDGDALLPVPAGPPAAGLVRLARPAPNPFNPATRIAFTLARDLRVSLRVYDLCGRLVSTLVDGALTAGDHTVTWQGRDGGGRRVASGSYLLRLEAGGEVVTERVVLVE